MVKAIEPDKIPITSTAQLASEFATLQLLFDKDETEHTWEQIDKGLKRFHAVVRGGACKFIDEFVKRFRSKEIVIGIVRSMATERTRLSASTLDLLAAITRLGSSFAPLLPLYLPPLLRLLCRTNKLYISRAQSTLSSILSHTHLIDILKYIVSEWKAESGKSTSFRIGASELLLAVLNTVKSGDIDKENADKRVVELEWIVKTGATDREAKVRGEIKKVWEIYKEQWPERITTFTGPMTPVIRRYLNVSGAAVTTQTTTRLGGGTTTTTNLHRAVVTSTVLPILNSKRDGNSSEASSKAVTKDVGTCKPASKSTMAMTTTVSSILPEVTTHPRSIATNQIRLTTQEPSLEMSLNSSLASTSISHLDSKSSITPVVSAIVSKPPSRPIVVSSSRGAFKPSTSLSRSLGPTTTSSGQPPEPKKARRFVPPTLEASVSIEKDLNLTHDSLSRSTSSTGASKKTFSISANSTPGPFRPQPSSSKNVAVTGVRSKPPMAGRAISTGTLPSIVTLAQRAPLLSRSVTSSVVTTIEETSQAPIRLSSEDKLQETISKQPHEVPLPLDEEAEEEEGEETKNLDQIVTPSFDAELDELVKQATHPNEDTQDSIDSPSVDDCLKKSLEKKGGGILDDMLLMEEVEPSAIESITEAEVLTCPKLSGKKEKEELALADEISEEEEIIIDQHQLSGEEAKVIGPQLDPAEGKILNEIVENENVVEKVIVELELEDKLEAEHDILEEVSIHSHISTPLSPKKSVLTPPRPVSVPLPVSPFPSPSTSLLSSPSNSILNSTPFPSRTLSSLPSHPIANLSPSAFHTTSFLIDTPLKSNTLPIVRFPKISLPPTNILTESPTTSLRLVEHEYEDEREDLIYEISRAGDDEEQDEGEEEEEEISSGASQSFCVPLNDLSQFGDEEEELSDTRSDTPESQVGKVFFTGDILDERLDSVIGDSDDTVIFDRSLRASRTRSRSRGRIVRDEG